MAEPATDNDELIPDDDTPEPQEPDPTEPPEDDDDSPAGHDDDAPEGDDDEPSGGEPSKPAKGTASDRIQELVAERNAAMEWGEYWRNQAQASTQPAKAPAEEPANDKAPQLEDFEFDAIKWAEAHAEWTEKRIEARAAEIVREQMGKSRIEDAKAQARDAYNKRVAAFSEAHPDFRAVISNRGLAISDTMTEVILGSEKGPDIAYHLGKHPTEAVRISRLSPTQQAAALGRIEAGLESAAPSPKPKTKKPSNAPAPPNPISGGSPPGINLETCSLQDYLSHRLGRRK